MAQAETISSAVIRTSPHFKDGRSTRGIMGNVVLALLPIVVFAAYSFGISVLLLVGVTVAACLLTEALSEKFVKMAGGVRDFTAAITGILLALTLPPGFPLWMAALGGIVSILVGKVVFGGIGFNVFNPALVGRAFLQAAFPVAITTWQAPLGAERFSRPFTSSLTLPFLKPSWDGLSGATPLSAFKFDGQAANISDLFVGFVPGSAGETSAILVVLCGLYLALRKMLDWRIPLSYLATVALLGAISHHFNPTRFPTAAFLVGGGGLMLGAMFMATDMVSSPVTPLGVYIFGLIIGLLTWLIRVFGGLPEGVMYAILLGNALTPLINQFTKPRVYGTT